MSKEERKTSTYKRNRHGGENPYSKTKDEKQKPSFNVKDEKGNLEEASGVAGRLGQPSCPGFPESKFSHAVKTSNLNWITSCRVSQKVFRLWGSSRTASEFSWNC